MTFIHSNGGHWRQHPDHEVHMSNMGMPTLAAPYDGSQHIPGVQDLRTLAPVSPHMDVNMPAFPAHSMAPSLPYRSGVFAFDPMSANHYAQQSIPVAYSPVATHVAHYSGNTEASDNRAHFDPERSYPPVKVDHGHPVTPDLTYTVGPSSVSRPEAPASTSNTPSLVDVLMREIQARQRIETEPSPSPSLETAQGSAKAKRARKGQKQLRCPFEGCDMAFRQKTHLEQHKRIHTGDKPFKCTFCPRRFSQKGNCQIHINRHLGKKDHQCPTCHHRFVSAPSLRTHQASVHGQAKNFPCILCGKDISSRGNLKTHIQKLHVQELKYYTELMSRTTDPTRQLTGKDKEIHDFFAEQFKNSNRGIPGRGKGRRVARVGTGTMRPDSGSASPYNSASLHSHGWVELDRSSRSSSMVSDPPLTPGNGFEFIASPGPAWSPNGTSYEGPVFPERHLYN